MKEIQILCVNDFHAEIFEGEQAPGGAKLATAIKNWKKIHPHSLIVFGGDNFRGDIISERSGGRPVTALMKRVGVCASVLGNHEFDFSENELIGWQEEGEFVFLGANVIDSETGKNPDYVKPYLLKPCNGIKVALIGLATIESMEDIKKNKDFSGVRITNGVEAAKYWIQYLKSGADQEGIPDIIIALTHYGLKFDMNNPYGDEILELCNNVETVDGVFAAHWHQALACEINHIPIAEGGCRGQGFAVIKIAVNENKKVKEVSSLFVDLREMKMELEDDVTVAGVTEQCKDEVMRSLKETIGTLDHDIIQRDPVTNEIPITGTELTRLACRVMKEKTGCPIALFYSGWMIGNVPKGPITLYRIYQALRFNVKMVAMSLSGEDLLRILENGIRTLCSEGASPLAVDGIIITVDIKQPYGKRMISAMLPDGTPIKAQEIYRIVVDDSLAENGTGLDFSTGQNRTYYDYIIRECMIETIRDECKIVVPEDKCIYVLKSELIS